MAEITFTLPGAIPYSNVIVKATPEEFGLKDLDAYSLGVASVVFLNLFNQGMQQGKGIDVSPPKGETVEVVDVDARTIDVYETNIANQSMEETKRILEDGLGSTTEVKEPWKRDVKAAPKVWDEPSADASDDDDF